MTRKKVKLHQKKRNRIKYYHFHIYHGHNTKDCISLKDEIESIIQKGYLIECVARDNHNSPQQSNEIELSTEVH